MFKRLLANWHLKLLSLVFAVVMWLFIVGEQKQERGFAIPLVIKNVPEGLMVASEVPSSVDVRIIGPRTLLANLASGDLSIVLDLDGLSEGVTTFRRLEDHVNLPGGLRVSRLTPSFIDVLLDRRISRSLPVKATIKGTPDKGFSLGEVTVLPATVTLEGAAGELLKVTQVVTEPVVVDGAQAPVKANPGLVFTGKFSRIADEPQVEVTVDIQPAATTNRGKKR